MVVGEGIPSMIATLAPPPICVVKSFYSSSAPLPKLALGAAVALGALSFSPGSAQAYVVTVGGVQYDVTTFTGSYDGDPSQFATAANGGVMPWWGDSSKALAFATAVGNDLGTTFNGYFYSGPFFGYSYIFDTNINQNLVEAYRYVSFSSSPVESTAGPADSTLYAKATLYTPSVPGPLPLFGAAAAFGFRRRLSRRSKRLRHGVTSRRA
jgi:hypothetical protein